MARSILLSSFILLCVTVIESSILSNLSFLYVVPDIVLICSIYFSLLNGRTVGVSNGFISGMFLDFITGVPFGFNCLYRTLIGYAYGLFSNTIIISGVMVPMLTVGIGTLVKAILVHLVALFFPSVNIYVTGIISYQLLFEFIENVILAPFIFKFLGFFRKYLIIRTTKDRIDDV
ncbi:MAG: rod shape-determining protein MreD [Treponema sp.]|nr:rod shape-determining protein MreD [Treponema sp.]